MLVQLKYKNDLVPGFFISDEGKIYNAEGIEQEQHICLSSPYFYFKSYEVHKLMTHSFFGYKEGFDVHHKNEIKTDNRLQNLVYLTHAEHRRLHNIGNKNCLGKKFSEATKQKMSDTKKGKKLSEQTKEKLKAVQLGKKRSEQTKEKIRAAKKKKSVFCVQLNKVFAGVNIAAKELSLHRLWYQSML